MPRGPYYYPSKGVCIYCGRGYENLTNEHIVPYALGGSQVIRQASCLECADITKKFEQRVARDLWGTARTAFNGPTRRKKERRKQTHIEMSGDKNTSSKLKVPTSEYPAGMVFYRMGKAGLLSGLPETVDISGMWKLIVIDDHKRRENFLNKYSEKLTLKFRHVPDSYGQLLAKIGYCQALSILDPSDFNPICLPYILGKKSNLSYIVGGSLNEIQPEPENGYNLSIRAFGTRKKMMIVALVRLYAHLYTSVYHVVVGDVVGAEKVGNAVGKLEPFDIAVMSKFNSKSTLDHWLPSVDPLPYWN